MWINCRKNTIYATTNSFALLHIVWIVHLSYQSFRSIILSAISCTFSHCIVFLLYFYMYILWKMFASRVSFRFRDRDSGYMNVLYPTTFSYILSSIVWHHHLQVLCSMYAQTRYVDWMVLLSKEKFPTKCAIIRTKPTKCTHAHIFIRRSSLCAVPNESVYAENFRGNPTWMHINGCCCST